MVGPLPALALLAVITAISAVPPSLEARSIPQELRAVADDWVAEREDNICGLSDLRALSDPARVDYDHLWDATPEVKKMKREGIDPESAEGISLQQKATDRIREACDEVREDEDHCSVWKEIRHEDGRRIADITKKVGKKFPDDLDD